MGYSVVNADEVELGGRTGQVRFVRRVLGVEAFGINMFELPPNATGHEHDEVESGQEEVSFVVRGSGTWFVSSDAGKEEVPVREGTFIRFDPETVRVPLAGPDGLTFVSIGTKPGSYVARGPF
jgi:quercetin dioxygenase-like cupin family protein